MSNNDNIDITALAQQAHAAGYDSPERVVARLEKIIGRNLDYLKMRRERGRRGAFNEVVEEDSKVIAMAVVLIESLAHRGDEWLREYTERAVRHAIKFDESCDEQGIQNIIDEIIEGKERQ